MKIDFVILDETKSTNSEALRRAKFVDKPTFILAKKQTNGRGRSARLWVDPVGNFSGTILIKLDDDFQKLALRSFVAAISVYDAIDEEIGSGHQLSLKWPNDILLNEKKICGILLETKKIDNAIALAIGIGINLMSVPRLEKLSQVTTEPGSIFNESGIEIDPVEFCKSIADHYLFRESQFQEMGFSKIREIWMKRAANLGKEIVARTPSSEYRGIFDSIDEKGQLVLTNNMEQTKIAAAEIFFSNG